MGAVGAQVSVKSTGSYDLRTSVNSGMPTEKISGEVGPRSPKPEILQKPKWFVVLGVSSSACASPDDGAV